MSNVRRTLVAALSAGWLFPVGISAACLLTLLEKPGPFGIVSPVDLSRTFLAVAFVWLALVIVFWAWRSADRAGWAIGLVSAGWLIPVWIAARPMYLLFDLVNASGSGKGLPLLGEAPRLVTSATYTLVFGCVWLAAVIAFWSWRLAVSKPRG